jgi:hypothetical protein
MAKDMARPFAAPCPLWVKSGTSGQGLPNPGSGHRWFGSGPLSASNDCRTPLFDHLISDTQQEFELASALKVRQASPKKRRNQSFFGHI